MQEACCVYKRIRAELNLAAFGGDAVFNSARMCKVWQTGVLVACVVPVCYLTVT